MSPDGSDLLRLTTSGDAFAPVWSPDGTQIAYGSVGADPNIFVMAADGSGVTKVTAGSEEKVHPAWAPDGRSILYVQYAARGYGGETSLREVSLDDGTVTVLDICDCQWPAWAPDGSRIAYVSFVPEGDDPHIRVPSVFVMQPDGSGGTNLLAQGMWGHRPRWSPDGAHIVFPGFDHAGLAYDVWVMDVDGTHLTRLTTSGSNGSAAFSKDGTRVAFDHQVPGGPSTLWVMNADGTDAHEIPGPPGSLRYPTWRP